MNFKPKILKENGIWILKYFYYPRSFNTFGMNSTERINYQKNCFEFLTCFSFDDALVKLHRLYKNREIYNQRFITK